ncbi:MAG: hypothetical protein AABY22_26895, partial [Nanoarchaeota archaeon]
MQKEKLNHFLKWVDECTHFFTDKDITIRQVVDEYTAQFPYLDFGAFGGEENFKKECEAGRYNIPPGISQEKLNESKRRMVCEYHTKQLFETKVMPVKEEWYICYVAGKRKILKYNLKNKFWYDFVG